MSEDCPICLNEIKDNFTISCCKKSYCKVCIDQWYICNSTCPMCRKDYKATLNILEYNALLFDIMQDLTADIHYAIHLLEL